MANEVLRYEHIDELDTYFADLKIYSRGYFLLPQSYQDYAMYMTVSTT